MRLRKEPTPRTGRKSREILVDKFQGLNTTAPYTQLKNGVSPEFENCRLYARNSTDRRVAVGTRGGPGFYSVPLGETVDATLTSTSGASDQTLNDTGWLGQIFTASSSGVVSKVEINIKNGTSPTQHVIVALYSNSGGSPGTLLGQSSILTTSVTSGYQYLSARFVEAPTVASGTSYWVVVYMQMGGSGNYLWSSTTSATTAKTSNNSGATWSSAAYALNYKIYVSTSGRQKGFERYTPTSGSDKTLIAHGTNVYTINDVDGTTSSIKSGLSSSATDYYFAQFDDKIFWTNGQDQPMYYDGSSVSNVSGAPAGATNVIFHKNRAWFVDKTNPTKIVYSDLGDFSSYLSTSFIYVPNPKSGDPIVGWTIFQDNLTIFTRRTKYVLYGDDPGNFVLRQSSGKRGAVNQKVIKTDSNYIYFLSDDGVYRYNGSSDELISDSIQNLIDGMGDKTLSSAVNHNNYYRLYYPDFGNTIQDSSLLWDTINNFWLHDTDTYIENAITLKDGTLIEGSSRMGAVFYGERQFSDLGKPIAFKYWTKYFGDGLHKVFLRRFVPSIRLQTQPYDLNIYIDIDQRNTIPLRYTVNAQASGSLWGGGDTWGGGALWGSNVVSTPKTLRGTEAYWHQIRFEQTGVDTPVEILSYILEIRSRRVE